MAYPAAAWSRATGSDATGLDCKEGLTHSDTGDWFSVYDPGECPRNSGWELGTKQGYTPEIVPIRRGFSMPVATIQLCCEVFSIYSFNNS